MERLFDDSIPDILEDTDIACQFMTPLPGSALRQKSFEIGGADPHGTTQTMGDEFTPLDPAANGAAAYAEPLRHLGDSEELNRVPPATSPTQRGIRIRSSIADAVRGIFGLARE
jgi:hypothetical protein